MRNPSHAFTASLYCGASKAVSSLSVPTIPLALRVGTGLHHRLLPGRLRAASRPTAAGTNATAAFSGTTAARPPPVTTWPAPALKREQSASTQPTPSPVPPPPPPPQAAPALREPAVPEAAPVGWGGGIGGGTSTLAGTARGRGAGVRIKAVYSCRIRPPTPNRSRPDSYLPLCGPPHRRRCAVHELPTLQC